MLWKTRSLLVFIYTRCSSLIFTLGSLRLLANCCSSSLFCYLHLHWGSQKLQWWSHFLWFPQSPLKTSSSSFLLQTSPIRLYPLCVVWSATSPAWRSCCRVLQLHDHSASSLASSESESLVAFICPDRGTFSLCPERVSVCPDLLLLLLLSAAISTTPAIWKGSSVVSLLLLVLGFPPLSLPVLAGHKRLTDSAVSVALQSLSCHSDLVLCCPLSLLLMLYSPSVWIHCCSTSADVQTRLPWQRLRHNYSLSSPAFWYLCFSTFIYF